MSDTVVLQSHANPLPHDWLTACTGSVETWSAAAGYDYVRSGDELFDPVPIAVDYPERCSDGYVSRRDLELPCAGQCVRGVSTFVNFSDCRLAQQAPVQADDDTDRNDHQFCHAEKPIGNACMRHMRMLPCPMFLMLPRNIESRSRSSLKALNTLQS